MYDKPKDIFNLVKNAISGDIKNGNLAFLLLTSKSEHYIRDKVALELYRKLTKKGFLISREWASEELKREWGSKKAKIDLAILRENNPEVLIEFKLNTVAGSIPGFEDDIKKDFGKLNQGSIKKAHRFVVFMSLLPDKLINIEFKGLLKYRWDGLNNFFRKCLGDIEKGIGEVCGLIGVLDNKIRKNSRQYTDVIEILPAGKFYNDANLVVIFWVLNLK